MIKKFLILDRKKQKMILLLAGVLIIALGTIIGGGLKEQFVAGNASEEDIVLEQEPVDAVEESVKEIQVYVSGAVEAPGVYTLKEGDRVTNALELAKPLEEADIESLNLAQILTDESKVTVPIKGEVVTETAMTITENNSTASNISGTEGKVNVNTATAAELETVNGIGPQMAKKIINYRETNGSFTTLDDLINISGIGEKTLAKISSGLTI